MKFRRRKGGKINISLAVPAVSVFPETRDVMLAYAVDVHAVPLIGAALAFPIMPAVPVPELFVVTECPCPLSVDETLAVPSVRECECAGNCVSLSVPPRVPRAAPPFVAPYGKRD